MPHCIKITTNLTESSHEKTQPPVRRHPYTHNSRYLRHLLAIHYPKRTCATSSKQPGNPFFLAAVRPADHLTACFANRHHSQGARRKRTLNRRRYAGNCRHADNRSRMVLEILFYRTHGSARYGRRCIVSVLDCTVLPGLRFHLARPHSRAAQ